VTRSRPSRRRPPTVRVEFIEVARDDAFDLTYRAERVLTLDAEAAVEFVSRDTAFDAGVGVQLLLPRAVVSPLVITPFQHYRPGVLAGLRR
jgi:hypothetical protein